MAGSRIRGISVEINGNTTQLTKELRKVNSSIYKTQTELRDVNKLLKLDPKNTELLSQKQTLLRSAIDDTKQKLEQEKQALEQLKKAGNTEETQAQQRALEREIIDTTQSLNKLQNESQDVDRALDEVGDESKDAAQDMNHLGDEAQKTDKKLGGIDGEKVKKVLHGVATAAKATVAGMVAIGGAAVAVGKKIYDSAKETAEHGNEIDKYSQKLGLSAEAYQKWEYVLSQADVDITSMTTGLKTLTNKIDDAKNGSEAAQGMFAKLGISLEDLNTMSREDIFAATIKGFQGLEDSTERAALANDLFGKSGQNLTPLFNESAEATEELMRKAEDYGMIMSNEAVEASAAFCDSLDTLSKTATGLKNRLMGELLPGITQITDGLALMFTRDGVEEGVAKFSEGIETTMHSLSDMLATAMEIGAPILLTIAQSIVENMPTLMNEGVIPMIQTLGAGVLTMLPDLILILQELLVSVAQELPGIVQSVLESGVLETLLSAGLEILMALVQGITEAISSGGLIETAFKVISELVNGLAQNLPAIITAAVDLIVALALALTQPDSLMLLIDAAINLTMALADGLIQAIPQLIAAVPQLTENIWRTIIQAVPKLLSAGQELTIKLAQGLLSAVGQVISNVASIGNSIWNAFQGFINKALNWGRDLIGNFISGIKAKWEAAKSTLEGIANFISGLFHHSTPDFGPLKDDDKWFSDMMDNFINGMEKKMPELKRTLNNVADEINDGIPTLQIGIPGVSAAAVAGNTSYNTTDNSLVVNQYNTYTNPHSDYELWQSEQALRRSVQTLSRGAI